jgi:hypothetical protein
MKNTLFVNKNTEAKTKVTNLMASHNKGHPNKGPSNALGSFGL